MIPWPVTQLLPHSGNAILLDEILSFDAESLTARTRIKPSGLYNQPDGSLPAWLGLEIMAQAVAAWAGCQARRDSLPIKLGFLLGTRRYECRVPAFAPGLELTIAVRCSLKDESGIGSFDCEMRDAKEILASARLNAYSPSNVNDFIQETPPST